MGRAPVLRLVLDQLAIVAAEPLKQHLIENQSCNSCGSCFGMKGPLWWNCCLRASSLMQLTARCSPILGGIMAINNLQPSGQMTPVLPGIPPLEGWGGGSEESCFLPTDELETSS